ncbi:MAG: hypothetical protein IPM92_00135 [Saprospiraceae bacterium]|nr:hypothetical protein [Saprospiraceae bacterium]
MHNIEGTGSNTACTPAAQCSLHGILFGRFGKENGKFYFWHTSNAALRQFRHFMRDAKKYLHHKNKYLKFVYNYFK